MSSEARIRICSTACYLTGGCLTPRIGKHFLLAPYYSCVLPFTPPANASLQLFEQMVAPGWNLNHAKLRSLEDERDVLLTQERLLRDLEGSMAPLERLVRDGRGTEYLDSEFVMRGFAVFCRRCLFNSSSSRRVASFDSILCFVVALNVVTIGVSVVVGVSVADVLLFSVFRRGWLVMALWLALTLMLSFQTKRRDFLSSE